MASRDDPRIKGISDGFKIKVNRLSSGHAHFLKNMIIAAGYKDAGFFDFQLLDLSEVFFFCADPGSNCRKLVAKLHTLFDCLLVLFCIYEKFGLADNSVGPAEPCQILKQIHPLFYRIWCHGLHSVPKGRVRDPNIRRHIHRHPPLVKCNFGNFFVVKHLPVKIRFFHILQRIFVDILF